MRRWISILFTPNAWDIVNLLQAAFPILAGGGTAMLGLYDGLPLMWVVVGAALTFAGIANGMVGYRNYIFQRDPEHKLKFLAPLVSRDNDFVNLGFDVRNDAVFPIEICMSELTTSCSQRISPQKSPWVNVKLQVAPGETRFYHDAGIDISDIRSPVMNGRIELSLLYGHPGRLSCKIRKDLNLFIPMDRTLPFQHTDRLAIETGSGKMDNISNV